MCVPKIWAARFRPIRVILWPRSPSAVGRPNGGNRWTRSPLWHRPKYCSLRALAVQFSPDVVNARNQLSQSYPAARWFATAAALGITLRRLPRKRPLASNRAAGSFSCANTSRSAAVNNQQAGRELLKNWAKNSRAEAHRWHRSDEVSRWT